MQMNSKTTSVYKFRIKKQIWIDNDDNDIWELYDDGNYSS